MHLNIRMLGLKLEEGCSLSIKEGVNVISIILMVVWKRYGVFGSHRHFVSSS